MQFYFQFRCLVNKSIKIFRNLEKSLDNTEVPNI